VEITRSKLAGVTVDLAGGTVPFAPLPWLRPCQGHRSWCQWKEHMWLPISH